MLFITCTLYETTIGHLKIFKNVKIMCILEFLFKINLQCIPARTKLVDRGVKASVQPRPESNCNTPEFQ